MTQNVLVTPYEQLGGEAAIRALVHRFYELMDELPETYAVRQMHPANLAGTESVFFEYLSGWFGGPALYTEKKGHPRLRMRHAPYAVSQAMRDEWMLCMSQTLTEQVADIDLRDQLIHTFDQMATHLVNTDGSHSCTA